MLWFMNGTIPYWYGPAAGTVFVSLESAGVAAGWPVGPVCSVGAGQTGSCSRVGVLVVSADCWTDDPSWPGGTGGGTAWSFGLDKKGHVKVSVHQGWLIGLISSNAVLPVESIFCCLICSFWRRCWSRAWWLGLTLDSRPVCRGTGPSRCPGSPCLISDDLSFNPMAA